MILVKCQYCRNQYEYGGKCNCKKIKYKFKNNSNKNYDKNKRNKERDKFYHSNAWKILRKTLVNKFYGLDIYELYKTGNIVSGNTGHHIIEVKDNKNRMYDLENLILLSASNHMEIHSIYNNSPQEKKKLQEYLFRIAKIFKEEFL